MPDGVLAQEAQAGYQILQIVDDERGDARERVELSRPRQIFREPDSHDGPGGLLSHRCQELEILRRVGQACSVGADHDEAAQTAAPLGRDDHAARWKSLREAGSTPVEVSLQYQRLSTDGEL